MTARQRPTREETLKANKYVHSNLANSGEYQKSPHFRIENKKKVRGIVEHLQSQLSPAIPLKALDFGCGTGFMIDLMKNLFSEVHGVDITQEMMDRVDISSGNVFLHESLAEHTAFPEAYFDFASAYSFMDHLFEPSDFLREVFRVLKPGGIFYSDLNPNRDFIEAMCKAETIIENFPSSMVEREIFGALHNGEYYLQTFGISSDMLEKAEPIKSIDRGFSPVELVQLAKGAGFSHIEIEHDWFLGQAKVMHEISFDHATEIDSYLRSVLPVSSHLYKYLRLIIKK